ncbi:hypothetical protein BV25DRAFT_1896715 [Artomyces pyxidatus]|uniref:Uncharacterized protein n=1 Tax=Artomyces pyxidatus TaxID=48021 RepID=A0ACB8TH48_9AGAM|nr:hypothetical protein BV25DRAFT_1896715 [Artomyces pyxidatus]
MAPVQIEMVDPLIRAFHDATLPSRDERRENLSNILTQCANFAECGTTKPRSELKVCSKCKLAKYCSQTCQKSHWRSGHKVQCTPPGDGSRESLPLKLAERVLAVPVLVDKLLHCSILTLDLLNDPSNSERAVVKLNCTVLGADVQAHMQRVFAGLPRDEGAEVCLSIAQIKRAPMEEADEKTRAAVADMRARLGEQITADRPMVTFWFVSEEDDRFESADDDEKPESESQKAKRLDQWFSSSMLLPAGAIAYMATKPSELVRSAVMGNQLVPISESYLRESINNTIRLDTKNKLRLRAYPTVARK